MRRRPTLFAFVGVALILAAQPAVSRASSITYELKNTSAAGTAAVDQVIANVSPPGLIDQNVPPPYGPLTILPGSQGFDKNQLFVSVGDGTIPAGQPNAGSPYQLLLLTFEKGGLLPGGVLDFSLKLTQPNATPPQLQLPPSTTGLSLVQITQTPSSSPGISDPGNTPNPPAHNTPEPLSLILWSTVAGAGILRARKVKLKNMTRA